MNPHQGFDRISIRQISFVPQDNPVIVYFQLDMHTGIIFVNDAVEDCFTKRRFGNLQLFYALQSLVMNGRSKIFCLQYIHDPISHLKDIPLDRILNNKIRFTPPEAPDSELHTREKLERSFTEKQKRGIFESTGAIYQTERLQHLFNFRTVRFNIYAMCKLCFFNEVADSGAVNIL